MIKWCNNCEDYRNRSGNDSDNVRCQFCYKWTLVGEDTKNVHKWFSDISVNISDKEKKGMKILEWISMIIVRRSTLDQIYKNCYFEIWS